MQIYSRTPTSVYKSAIHVHYMYIPRRTIYFGRHINIHYKYNTFAYATGMAEQNTWATLGYPNEGIMTQIVYAYRSRALSRPLPPRLPPLPLHGTLVCCFDFGFPVHTHLRTSIHPCTRTLVQPTLKLQHTCKNSTSFCLSGGCLLSPSANFILASFCFNLSPSLPIVLVSVGRQYLKQLVAAFTHEHPLVER